MSDSEAGVTHATGIYSAPGHLPKGATVKRLGTYVLLFALAALVLVATGCASQPESGEPGDDGLHSTVPSVMGLSESEATDALAEAGYQVGEVTFRESADASPGTVVEQDPIASTSVPRDSSVDLVIAEP